MNEYSKNKPRKYKERSISVIMPTYNNGAFIRRALASLFAQTIQDWELILINDGSNDYTEDVIEDYRQDSRVRYYRNDQNKGLGNCLNMGIEYANCNYICYLPSDDIYFTDHLSNLYNSLSASQNIILSYSGLYYDNTDNLGSGLSTKKTLGLIPNSSLQLVQVMHRKGSCKWIERNELVTADLDKMYWGQLREEGTFVGTNIISCEWVSHPFQRHKIISTTKGGGLAFYKKYYQVTEQIKFHNVNDTCIDENENAIKFQQAHSSPGKLKILIVGELGFNPERILAFEEDGHQLYGLWISNPEIHNAVGPFPFGNIVDLDINNIQSQIEKIQPDIIYALLNSQAVKLAHYIMVSNPQIPFIWHFKEGPLFCRNYGIWNEMVELFYNADGQIFINKECKDWFSQIIGDVNSQSLILDGDLPPSKWFIKKRSCLLSETDGAIHTLVSGRPYGIKPQDVAILSKYNVHLHLYGEFYHSMWSGWVDQVNQVAKGHLHVHPHCKPENWAKEYSKYDAGWLHCFDSLNNGELMKCSWDDLNYPARMSTLAAAGLPMIQKNNEGHIVATQDLITNLKTGLIFDTFDELGELLNNKSIMDETRKNVFKQRLNFSFDHYFHELIHFFEEVIKNTGKIIVNRDLLKSIIAKYFR
ncbi:glycosyltransferase family 2 protein [Niabella hibiscisoli]|uniref:glycosyltransferase family 2 protein n=1 Tax=Niabella hibiscisoli TaxID=1825928 RepID=UPI001F106C4C|nr:glycosyltransferase family 2 protein [Niabella hibiscisoli]MCH5716253.1 glycosyltransferase [Niabella hibiscisoli]